MMSKENSTQRRIAILGSTGSIGTQTLDVIRDNEEKLEVYALTANNNAKLLIQQAREFAPEVVVIANEDYYKEVKEALSDLPIKVWAGFEALCQIVTDEAIDIVMVSLVGYAGLLPTVEAIKAGKTIALANKEVLVVAGEIIMSLASKHRVPIIPVDSEHSAIFQCLNGEWANPVEKILLTASGGPFRMKTMEELQTVSPETALKHPNWAMGNKVTIDSATLMNKGLEMIEARWLFDVSPSQIEVVVHPQSIIHSMVQYEDGSVMAQLSMPDMKLPIAYALSYPQRMPNAYERMDLLKLTKLEFYQPDVDKFQCLALAFSAINSGGNMPCTLNAANEIAVNAFLNNRLSFLNISKCVEKVMEQITFLANPTLDDYAQTDKTARIIAARVVDEIEKR